MDGKLTTIAWPASYGREAQPRVGFFTDTSVCIGCKACEVACKEWNAIPEDGLTFTGMSMDNTVGLGASTWRHVAFVEQQRPMPHTDALAPIVLDRNVHIQEVKAWTADIRPGRRPRGPALVEFVARYRDRAAITERTGTEV